VYRLRLKYHQTPPPILPVRQLGQERGENLLRYCQREVNVLDTNVIDSDETTEPTGSRGLKHFDHERLDSGQTYGVGY
jgi:hypothetical protein